MIFKTYHVLKMRSDGYFPQSKTYVFSSKKSKTVITLSILKNVGLQQ